MGTVTGSFFKKFRGSEPLPEAESRRSEQRVMRRSTGLAEFTRALATDDSLCVLDLGPTSPMNIQFVTGLGHKIYNEDVLAASMDPALAITDAEGHTTHNAERFMAENLAYRGPIFDAVLCWDVPDYLPETLVKPLVERLCAVTKRGGLLLGFFHTRDAGPDAPYYHYHLVSKDAMELQRASGPHPARGGKLAPAYRLQRVFNNRHIENLFREFASIKFFLGRDNVREVLVIR